MHTVYGHIANETADDAEANHHGSEFLLSEIDVKNRKRS